MTDDVKPVWTGKPLRILIAEDEPDSGQFLKRALNRLGFELDVAQDGLEAVQMWGGGDYDVILMDMKMPKMDGRAATRQIREMEQAKGGHIPVVAMTGSTTQEEQQSCLDSGMDACLFKPLDLQKVIGLLNDIFKSKRPK